MIPTRVGVKKIQIRKFDITFTFRYSNSWPVVLKEDQKEKNVFCKLTWLECNA